MYEFLSVSASSYDPAGLAAKLTDISAQGWHVVSIVQTGGDVTAFVRRGIDGADNGSVAETAPVSEMASAPVEESAPVQESVMVDATTDLTTADEAMAAHHDDDTNVAEGVLGAGAGLVGGAALADVLVDDDDSDWVISSDDLPEVDLPEDDLPEVDLPEVDLPAIDMPDVDLPAADFGSVDLPDVDLPAVDMPDVDLPAADFGSVDLPDVDVPTIDTPATDLPEVNLPAADFGSIDIPDDVVPEVVSEPAGWAVSPEAEVITSSYEPTVVSPVVEPAPYVYEPAPAPAPAPAPVVTVPAGWYADPAGRFELRYWDGLAWTEHVARGGQQYTDPPVA